MRTTKVLLSSLASLFFAMTCISTFSSCGNDKKYSEAEVEEIVKQAVADAIKDNGTSTVHDVVSDTTGENNSADTVAYQFKWLGSTATLKLDKTEGSAQLIFRGKTYYGKCEFDGYGTEDWTISGFSGTDDIDMGLGRLFKNECWYWSSSKYIDSKNNYLYLGQTEFEVKNPDYRIELVLVE